MVEACFVCSNEDFIKSHKKFGGEYWICQKCGLLVSSMIDGVEERHDRNSSFSGEADRDLRKNIAEEFSCKSIKKFSKQIRKVEKYRKKNRLLDIGCGTGGFLYAAKDLGWIVVGTEISKECIQAAKKKGLQVYCGSIENANLNNNGFDIIRMNNVIEHLADPLLYLLACNSLLRSDGLLILSTVNMDSFTASFLKEKWKYVDPRGHVHLFNKTNLSSLLLKTGFKTVSIKTRGVRTRLRKSTRGTLANKLLELPARALAKGHRVRVYAHKI